VLPPSEFLTHVNWPGVRPNFSGGDGGVNDVDDAEAGNEEEEAGLDAGSDASMDEGNEDYASDGADT
jgi:hypothetical protein